MATYMSTMTSDLYAHGRSDPEYYLPNHIEVEEKLNSLETLPLRRLGSFSCSAFYPAATHLYSEDGMPFLRCVDIIDFPLISVDQPFARIPQFFVNAHSSIRSLSAGDIVISKVGTPCFSSLLSDDMPEAAMTRTVLGMSNINKELINPFYLIAFLRSRFGFDQLMRERELTIQYQLTLERTRKVRVFIPDRSVQDDIGNDVKAYYQSLRNSKLAYEQAQNLLESELGLDKLKFQKPVGYSARFSELEQSRRLDAQHFQPRFDQLIHHISDFNSKRIRDIHTYNRRGIQPVYVEDGAVDVVNSQHLGPQHIGYDGLQKTSQKAFLSSPEGHIQKDDLLIYTTGAYIGRTNVYLSDRPALASNHVNILRLNSGIDAAYMSLVFQSEVGQLQTQKHARGSAQAELYPTDIDKFVVPLLDPSTQTAIGDLVRNSLAKQQESKELLAQAKTRVEQLIEESAQS